MELPVLIWFSGADGMRLDRLRLTARIASLLQPAPTPPPRADPGIKASASRSSGPIAGPRRSAEVEGPLCRDTRRSHTH